MAPNIKSRLLQYITLVYCFLYFGMFILPMIFSGFDPSGFQRGMAEMMTVLLAFLIFFAGTVYVWFHEKIGGILLCIWHFIVWGFSMLFWEEAGMVLLLIFPMLFPAVLLIRNWYIKQDESYNSRRKQWQLSLRLLLLNYAAIYLIVVFANVAPKMIGLELPNRVDELIMWDYTSLLGLMLLVTFALFIVGFLVSWKSEFVAGILFIIWYLIILFLTIRFPSFANSGPWALLGLSILMQGVIYIANNQNIETNDKYNEGN